MSAFSQNPETYKLPNGFNLTQHMAELKRKAATGALQREAEATAEQARVQADKDAALIAEEQRKAIAIQEARVAEANARMQGQLEAAREKADLEREHWRQAQIKATISNRIVSPGELAQRARDIAAARRS